LKLTSSSFAHFTYITVVLLKLLLWPIFQKNTKKYNFIEFING